MREVITYVAYDDCEFETREECIAHENEAWDALIDIKRSYSFYDINMKELVCPQMTNHENYDLETRLKWFDDASQTCEYILRFKNLKNETEDFINNWNGVCICNSDFNNETGLFKYDMRTLEWVKVDE